MFYSTSANPREEHLKGRVGSSVTLKHLNRLESLARVKQELGILINYGRKSFTTLEPGRHPTSPNK
jgi:hypothetical protein